jgi:hypothetical protein
VHPACVIGAGAVEVVLFSGLLEVVFDLSHDMLARVMENAIAEDLA